jgi:hypothetical protein
MSRTLSRSIARHKERQEQGLMKYAFERYGHTVALADLHPDVKMLFALNFELAKAADKGEAQQVAEAVEMIADFLSRYADQQPAVKKKEAIALDPAP